jgi:hypothetical protein
MVVSRQFEHKIGGGHMAPQKFRVTYKNHATQMIPADTFGTHGSFVVFSENQRDVATVAASEVRSVVREDMPDEETPEVFVG